MQTVKLNQIPKETIEVQTAEIPFKPNHIVTLLNLQIPFKTRLFTYVGLTYLHTWERELRLIDDLNQLVFSYSPYQPLNKGEKHELGKVKLEHYEYYLKHSSYPPNVDIDDLLQGEYFDTYEDMIQFLAQYICKLESVIIE